MFCKTHNVRPRSRQFIEARVLRLLWDTCCHHAEARVHRVAAAPSVRAGSQGRDLEVTRSRPNCHLNTPQTRRRCLHTSSIKAHLPPCSPDAPEDPTRVQPPEGERIQIYCAITETHFGLSFGYVPPLGLLRGVACLSHLHSHREPPHSPGPPSGLTRCQTVPLFWGI